MDMQAKKLELIKIIADIQSEVLLERLKHYLNLASKEDTGQQDKTFSEEVAALILKINEGLPEHTQLRYNHLMQKSVQQNLSESDHAELMSMIPEVEAKNAERLAYLVELAALWKCSVDETMEKLNIQIPPVVHG